MSSMTKDTLEGMAAILRENGYIVKENRKPYKEGKFNLIETLDLNTLNRETCIFVTDEGLGELKSGVNICSMDSTIGFINYLNNDYKTENVRISTNRDTANSSNYTEKLSDYTYVCKLKDVFNGFFGDDEW